MGLFGKRRREPTPAEIAAHKAEVRAHLARVDAARKVKQAGTVVVEAGSDRRVGTVSPGEASMLSVNGSGAWAYQRVLGWDERPVTATLRLLRSTKEPEVSVYVGGRKVGWLNEKNSACVGDHIRNDAPDTLEIRVPGRVVVHTNGVERHASLLVEDPATSDPGPRN
ncbi:hypothetical protein [Demequina sp.]|uniref:hypothetical protein n=1 Tax=Demequina sp. TaxID=2050685 RepID=UPI0025B990CF|nr:hypothetical protein [Demequina sp.]